MRDVRGGPKEGDGDRWVGTDYPYPRVQDLYTRVLENSLSTDLVHRRYRVKGRRHLPLDDPVFIDPSSGSVFTVTNEDLRGEGSRVPVEGSRVNPSPVPNSSPIYNTHSVTPHDPGDRREGPTN